MPTINQLNQVSQVYTSDQIPIYSNANGDARKASIQQLLELFQSSFASPEMATQLIVPTTGFNYAISSMNTNAWVLIQPAGGLTDGTVTLPLASNVTDGMEILITTTQQITNFSLSSNGASNIYGEPGSLSANAFFKIRFYRSTNSWYRVG